MPIKQLGKNTLIYALGNIGIRAGALVLIPLFTHHLSMAEYGLLATLQLTVQIFVIIMNGGMRICILRFTTEYKKNNQMDRLLGTSSVINLLWGGILTLLVFIFLMSFFGRVLHLDNPYPYLGVVCVVAVVQSLTVHLMAYYRVEDKAFTYMIIGIATVLLLIVTTALVLYGFNLGVMGALLASLLSYGLVLAWVASAVFSKTGIGISLTFVPALLRFGFPLIFSELALLIMGGAGVYLLGYFFTLEVVAVYSLGYKLAWMLIVAVIAPFQLAFQPFVYSSFEKAEFNGELRSIITYLVLAIAATIFSVLFASRLLLPLIAPPEYAAAFLVILFLLPGTAFVGIYYLGETLLGAVRKTHLIGLMMTGIAVLSLLLNYLLIPVMNWYGAALALNISFVLAGSVFFALGKRYFLISLEWRRIGICVLLMAICFLIFLALSKAALMIFILCSLAAALCGLAILYKIRFFKQNELALIKGALMPLSQ